MLFSQVCAYLCWFFRLTALSFAEICSCQVAHVLDLVHSFIVDGIEPAWFVCWRWCRYWNVGNFRLCSFFGQLLLLREISVLTSRHDRKLVKKFYARAVLVLFIV